MQRTIRSWQALQRLYLEQARTWHRWAFRGQQEPVLAPAIEKAFNRFRQPYSKARVEINLLREFKRHYGRIGHGLPSPRTSLEWLALMRHYGAPTRLVDWTYSFWIAVYFAVARRKP